MGYLAMEREPEYLPLHFSLADIFIRQGMAEDAVTKYMMIAALYEVYGNPVQASNVYRAILSLTPLDVKVRAKLIDLLINRKEIDQALEQYLALADAYYQLARVDKALETFNEALRLCERSESETAYRLKYLYFMADLYTQRVEWNKAADILQPDSYAGCGGLSGRPVSHGPAFQAGQDRAGHPGNPETPPAVRSAEGQCEDRRDAAGGGAVAAQRVGVARPAESRVHRERHEQEAIGNSMPSAKCSCRSTCGTRPFRPFA